MKAQIGELHSRQSYGVLGMWVGRALGRARRSRGLGTQWSWRVVGSRLEKPATVLNRGRCGGQTTHPALCSWNSRGIGSIGAENWSLDGGENMGVGGWRGSGATKTDNLRRMRAKKDSERGEAMAETEGCWEKSCALLAIDYSARVNLVPPFSFSSSELFLDLGK